MHALKQQDEVPVPKAVAPHPVAVKAMAAAAAIRPKVGLTPHQLRLSQWRGPASPLRG